MLAGMNVHFGEANHHVAQYVSPNWTLKLFVQPVDRQIMEVHDVSYTSIRTMRELGVELVDAEGTVYARTCTITVEL